MVSKNIVQGTREIRANILHAIGSYHWLICLNWDWPNATLSKPFRFNQLWLYHKDFKELVTQWCQEMVPPIGTVMYCFQQKLKSFKAKIHTWNREEFGNIFEDKKRLLSEIDIINKKGMEEGWDDHMKLKEKDLLGHLEARDRQERVFWE